MAKKIKEYRDKKKVDAICEIAKFISLVILIVYAFVGAMRWDSGCGILVIVATSFMMVPRYLFHLSMVDEDDTDEEEDEQKEN